MDEAAIEERVKAEVCERLDEVLFLRSTATAWINGSMRLDYLIGYVRDLEHTCKYLQRQVQVVEHMWKESNAQANLKNQEEE